MITSADSDISSRHEIGPSYYFVNTTAGYIACYQCSPFIVILSNDIIGCICFRGHFHTTISQINTRNVIQNSPILWLVMHYNVSTFFFFHSRTVHLDIIKVFYLPTDAQEN